MNEYHPRLIDPVLSEELEAFGGVLLTGPKWCGKTTTARQQARSVLFMQDPDNQENYRQLAEIQPSLLLQGENPRLIDEWQVAPALWDAIRHDIDIRGKEGLYILTGSTSVDETQIKHSGAGRISRLKMYTMSLFESNDSTGEVSLRGLFENHSVAGVESGLGVGDYARLICRGGWPNALGKRDEIAIRQIKGYCQTICTSDISTVDGIQRDPDKVEAVLRAYSRNISTQATNTTILSDIVPNQSNLHFNTLESYLGALRKLYVIDEISAWNPKLRSRTTIRTSNTRHFIDPAIAAYFLGASDKDLLFDFQTFGLLFESMVVRDLRIYAQNLNGKIYHYRDKSGLEIDSIVHLSDGRWGAVEVKLGTNQVELASSNLLKLKERVDVETMHAPSFLMVVTGTRFAYAREDGVVVVPLGCLGP
ncbi:MAG: DUF4143 domain-containing protein [Anaerolineaceae bacterium]